MSTYKHRISGEVREIDAAIILAWRDANNAKFAAWEPYTPPPPEPVAPQPCRVSKDTIISRVTELGALSLVMSALAQQTPEHQFVWTHSAWFWSDNATLRGLCHAIGLDAEAVLAPDPYIT